MMVGEEGFVGAITELLLQAGAALDVREQERDGAGGKHTHWPAPAPSHATRAGSAGVYTGAAAGVRQGSISSEGTTQRRRPTRSAFMAPRLMRSWTPLTVTPSASAASSTVICPSMSQR